MSQVHVMSTWACSALSVLRRRLMMQHLCAYAVLQLPPTLRWLTTVHNWQPITVCSRSASNPRSSVLHGLAKLAV